MMDLAKKTCAPCKKEQPPLTEDQARSLAQDVPGWTLPPGEPRLTREFKFADFVAAMRFVNQVADVAEKEGHHPDIQIHYNRVILVLWTHAIKGLSENDFILAAKIHALGGTREA
jgi:4a-hydroxytetrahydrobiopterin dehydratase